MLIICVALLLFFSCVIPLRCSFVLLLFHHIVSVLFVMLFMLTLLLVHYMCYCWFITLIMLFMVCHVASGGANCCIASITI
jgi:hypothetical protein